MCRDGQYNKRGPFGGIFKSGVMAIQAECGSCRASSRARRLIRDGTEVQRGDGSLHGADSPESAIGRIASRTLGSMFHLRVSVPRPLPMISSTYVSAFSSILQNCDECRVHRAFQFTVLALISDGIWSTLGGVPRHALQTANSLGGGLSKRDDRKPLGLLSMESRIWYGRNRRLRVRNGVAAA